MNKIKLDVKNQRLLNLLEKNSRTPISKIAKELNTSKEVVHYRLKKLLELGFIKRFYPLIDYFAFGYRLYRFVINLHNLKYHARKKIIEDLRKIKKLDLNVYLSSDWDLEIDIWVRNSEELYNFYNNFIKKHGEYIKDKELLLVTAINYYSHAYLHKNRHTIKIGEKKTETKIDETDERLIKALEENPKAEIIWLSEKIKLSPSATNRRIKNLIKNKVFLGCIPILNKSLLGYNTYHVEVSLDNPAQKQKFISHLEKYKNVIKITELIGSRDIDFELDCKTTVEVDTFLEELRLAIINIKDFEVINISND